MDVLGQEKETIQAKVDRVIFQSDQGFCIVSVISSENGKVVVKGTPPTSNFLKPGATYSFSGIWESHPKFGKQLSFSVVKEEIPQDKFGQEQFLINYVDGLGEKRAREIIERFDDPFQVIQNDFSRLTEIPGISSSLAANIKNSFTKYEETKEHLSVLSSWGLTPAAVNKITKKYKTIETAISTLKENPYILCQDVEGYGFIRADTIARSMGFSLDHPKRIQEGIIYCLQEATKSGHTYLPYTRLVFGWDRNTGAKNILGPSISEEQIKAEIPSLWKEQKRIFPFSVKVSWEDANLQERVGLPFLVRSEKRIYETAIALRDKEFDEMEVEEDETYERLNSDQKKAVDIIASGNTGLLIITGGAGVGKTFVIQKIIDIATKNGQTFSLMAPTGKAAKRIEETTGMQAKTIHRYLAFDPMQGEFTLSETYDNFIIVDEASMVDSHLMFQLIDVLHREENRLILVGDFNQLSPVGPGSPFEDLIFSKKFETIYLDEIMRTEGDSLIPINANHILENNRDLLSFDSKQMTFIDIDDASNIAEVICQVCNPEELNKNGFSFADVQVISPQHKGPAGTIILNERLQKIFNPNAKELEHFDYSINDRVIFTKNNYELNYVNGDQGYIIGETKVAGKPAILVETDKEPEIKITRSNLFDLEHAYAITIHKSQGSEWPCVIMPMHETHAFMLTRKLVYTAVTRGRYNVTLVGSEKGISLACKSDGRGPRYTLIQDFLNELDFQEGLQDG